MEPLECQFLSHRKNSRRKRDLNSGSSALEVDALTTRPTRRSEKEEEEEVTGMTRLGKIPTEKAGIEPGFDALETEV